MKALILAGGKGTRLLPLTMITPKSLIMIKGRPVIQYIIEHILQAGISEIIVCVSDGYGEHFRNALGDGERFGIPILYSIAPENVATSGRILRCSPLVGREDFLVYYGDILTSFQLKDLVKAHQSTDGNVLCTVAVSENMPLDIGVVKVNPTNHRVEQFIEKPTIGQISLYKGNMGIAILRHPMLRFCRDALDLFAHVVPQVIEHGKGVAFRVFKESFIDIGTIAALERATDLLKDSSRPETILERKPSTSVTIA